MSMKLARKGIVAYLKIPNNNKTRRISRLKFRQVSHEPYEKPNLLPSWKILTCFFSQRNWYRSWNSSVRTNVAKQIWKKKPKKPQIYDLTIYPLIVGHGTQDNGNETILSLPSLSLSLSLSLSPHLVIVTDVYFVTASGFLGICTFHAQSVVHKGYSYKKIRLYVTETEVIWLQL